MNWRWIVPAGLFLLLIETVSGFAAYGSSMWNFAHTEVLTHWAAVREVCLVFFPLMFGSVVAFGILIALAVRWASRGGR